MVFITPFATDFVIGKYAVSFAMQEAYSHGYVVHIGRRIFHALNHTCDIIHTGILLRQKVNGLMIWLAGLKNVRCGYYRKKWGGVQRFLKPLVLTELERENLEAFLRSL